MTMKLRFADEESTDTQKDKKARLRAYMLKYQHQWGKVPHFSYAHVGTNKILYDGKSNDVG